MKKFIFCLIGIALFFSACSLIDSDAKEISQLARIYPDYQQLTIPPNIAPLNFIIQEKGVQYKVRFSDTHDRGFTVLSRNGKIHIPLRKWAKLLDVNKGGDITLNMYVKHDGHWFHYYPVTLRVAKDPIDPYLSYRLIHPQTGSWKRMGIYQRDLRSFKETAIIENSTLDNSCVNCHHVAANNGNNFMFHVRAGQAGGTYISRDGEIQKISPKIYDLYNSVGYAWWHPNGRFIVFSTNSVNGRDVNQQSMHLINGADSKSDLLVYDIDNNAFYTDSLVFNSKYWESYPTWAPDGKTIYYCRARAIDAKNHDDLTHIQYNLMKVEFDIETHTWSTPETVIDAVSMNRSIAFPRISPDGRFLMYTLYDYGVFSIFRRISDLATYDISKQETQMLNMINTPETDSYHSWSSNGKWVVFTSKYPDGECGRPHIAYMDAQSGQASKAFILPQKDPAFYNRFILSYNLPELYHTPNTFSPYSLIKATQQPGIPATVKEGPGTDSYHKKKTEKTSLWRAG